MLLHAEKQTAKARIMQLKRSGLHKIRLAVNGGKYKSLRTMKIKDISREIREEVMASSNELFTPEQNKDLANNAYIWGGEVDEE